MSDLKRNTMEIISMDLRTFDTLMERVRRIEERAGLLLEKQADIGMKKWLDSQDVCELLGISKRTLQSYREKGLIACSYIRHKAFYRPEDVEKMLESSYHPQK